MLADRARAEAQRAAAAGDHAGAARILAAAAGSVPADAALANSAGNAALKAGLVDQAIIFFGNAATAQPGSAEYAINHAIALGRNQQPRAALAELERVEERARRDDRYCSVRASTARDAHRLDEARRWYDAALALNPTHARARHGRARVAMERAESDAVARYDHALEAAPQDAELWLGKAQALDAAGRFDEAIDLTRALVAQAPQWLDAVRFLAQLSLANGDADFSAPFRQAAQQLPQDPNIPAMHCSVLAGLDRFGEAAEVAAEAARRFPDIEHFGMLEAIHCGEAGDDHRADLLWQKCLVTGPERDLHEARHWLRRGDARRAEQSLDRVLSHDSSNVSAWAFLGIAWRLSGDPRSDWLHEQAGLVQLLPLRDREQVFSRAVEALHHLHDKASLPLNQSLRGGTQTRGGLFVRHEPVFGQLGEAVRATLEYYRATLPPEDAAHPLLRFRNRKWSFAGSWSVRLSGGGDHHASHIHPEGILSSALYCELPDDVEGEDKAGWLEIGRPPANLRLDLPPLQVIQPRTGHLALFPSTLFHGTRPFAGTRRLTVAFDVNLDQDRRL